MPKLILFWDSAALIRAVYSEEREPFRQLLRLGESGLVDMRISRDVIREVEGVIRKYGDDLVADFAFLMDRAGFAVTPAPAEETVSWCEELTGYRPDARIVAAAHECNADLLLTYDRQHLLDNPLLGPPEMRCRVVSPETAVDIVISTLRDSS